MKGGDQYRSRLRRFAGRSDATRFALLSLANALQRGSQFLVVPLFVATMSGDDFVRYGLFTATFSLLAPLLTLNIYLAHSRLYFDYESDRDRRDLLKTTLLGGCGASAVGFLLLLTFLRTNSVLDPLTRGDFLVQIGVAGAVMASIATYFFVWVFRVRDRTSAYVGMGAIIASGLPLGYWLLYRAGVDPLIAAVEASAAANVLAALTGMFLSREELTGGRFRLEFIRPAIAYSAGTAVYGISVWALSLSGRWIGALGIADDRMAAYTLFTQAYTLALVLTTVIFETFRVETLNAFAEGDNGVAMRRLNRTTLMVAFSLAGAYGLVGLVVLTQDLWIPQAYHVPSSWIPAGALYNLAMLVFIRSYWVAIGTKHTMDLAMTMPIAGAATIALSSYFVSEYAIAGLLAATVVGSVLQAGMGHWRASSYLGQADARR